MDKKLIAGTEAPVRAILPNLNVIQIGGLSIMDRGHTAVLPLLDEIVANQETYTQVIGVGPGVRARHILSVGLDLGLPTGALATLAAKSSAQNAYMVSCLLASHGFVYLEAPFVVQLLAGNAGGGARRRVQRHSALRSVGASSGARQDPAARQRCRLLSRGEVFGARTIILLKDVDGLYTADPKTHPDATLIPEISAADLLRMQLPTLPIEPVVLELLTRARLAKSIRIVNGLVPGNLTRALAGETVGTLIHA